MKMYEIQLLNYISKDKVINEKLYSNMPLIDFEDLSNRIARTGNHF